MSGIIWYIFLTGGIIWYIFQKPLLCHALRINMLNNRITERPSKTFTIYWAFASSYSTTVQLSVIALIATYHLLVSTYEMHLYQILKSIYNYWFPKVQSDSLLCSGTTSLPLSLLMKNSATFQVAIRRKNVC